MDLSELTADEKLAVVALIVQMVGADHGRSPEEMAEFRAIADEMGKASFDEALRYVFSAERTREGALQLAKEKVTRKEAQQLAHTVLVDLAAADEVSADEKALIDDVVKLWGLTTRK